LLTLADKGLLAIVAILDMEIVVSLSVFPASAAIVEIAAGKLFYLAVAGDVSFGLVYHLVYHIYNITDAG
jgi:hypothetical protein